MCSGPDFTYLSPGPDCLKLVRPDFIHFESESGFNQGIPECESWSGFYQFLNPDPDFIHRVRVAVRILSIFESRSGSGFYQTCPDPGLRAVRSLQTPSFSEIRRLAKELLLPYVYVHVIYISVKGPLFILCYFLIIL